MFLIDAFIFGVQVDDMDGIYRQKMWVTSYWFTFNCYKTWVIVKHDVLSRHFSEQRLIYQIHFLLREIGNSTPNQVCHLYFSDTKKTRWPSTDPCYGDPRKLVNGSRTSIRCECFKQLWVLFQVPQREQCCKHVFGLLYLQFIFLKSDYFFKRKSIHFLMKEWKLFSSVLYIEPILLFLVTRQLRWCVDLPFWTNLMTKMVLATWMVLFSSSL